MEIPWMKAGTADEGATALVMASRFRLRSAWRSPVFLVHSMRLWWQARRSPGALGLSLRASPFKGTFWTLSAWTDRKALYAYARANPHGAVMKRIRPWTEDSVFRFWELPVAELPRNPSGGRDLWADGIERLDRPEET
ncbi:hypothetical protein [Thermomonospora umbrina]|uniref:DUF3291 domain-containing protein n=1 Tax=Thermomonospora umbrina TaxID=111806 RepID=A0A3D9STT1_9ACTN|nr:hypothetical protein [Thermomonospora umbrina]REE99017.1 hypothetical protein DFJ69_4520 [Thermomonospora umbrina]